MNVAASIPPALPVRVRLWFACLLGAAAVAQAQPQPVASAATPSADTVRSWLLRIHQAASEKNFQGTFVVSGAGEVSSARIAHYCEANNQFERIESLDGEKRSVFRHNNVAHTLWPAAHVALVEQRSSLMSFPALLQAGDEHISDFYDVRPQGNDRVAGHEADLLLLRPKDAHRYGYRLWSEKASGLLLRLDVIGERNEVLETSAFSEVTIGVKPQAETVLQPMKRLDGYRIVRPALTPTRFEAEGWSLKQPVPGFKQISCVKRPMRGLEATDEQAAPEPVLQTIYSDGLTYVSVFIEPFNAQRHRRALQTTVGATQTLMRQHGDWWVTIVGDVPPATLRLFANGLERRK